MLKIYALDLCDQILLQVVNIMDVCIVAEVFLISSVWHFFAFHFSYQNLKKEFILKAAL